MNLSTLRSLQKRIREATGSDRELDCEIANFHGWRQDADYNYTPSGAMTLDEPPHYTSDPDGLGACVALMRATLPGAKWYRYPLGVFRIRPPELDEWADGYTAKPLANDCLTFIDAICAAKIAELGAEQEKERVG